MTTNAFRLNGSRQLFVEQGADDILDYGVDVADVFPAGDSIQSASWQSTGVTVSAPEEAGTVATAFVAGTSGSVSVTLTSVAGRKKRVDFLVQPPA